VTSFEYGIDYPQCLDEENCSDKQDVIENKKEIPTIFNKR